MARCHAMTYLYTQDYSIGVTVYEYNEIFVLRAMHMYREELSVVRGCGLYRPFLNATQLPNLQYLLISVVLIYLEVIVKGHDLNVLTQLTIYSCSNVNVATKFPQNVVRKDLHNIMETLFIHFDNV